VSLVQLLQSNCVVLAKSQPRDLNAWANADVPRRSKEHRRSRQSLPSRAGRSLLLLVSAQ
jgi:hypothetical protein